MTAPTRAQQSGFVAESSAGVIGSCDSGKVTKEDVTSKSCPLPTHPALLLLKEVLSAVHVTTIYFHVDSIRIHELSHNSAIVLIYVAYH